MNQGALVFAVVLAAGLAHAADLEPNKAAGDFGMFRQPLPDPDGRVQGKWDFPPLRPLAEKRAGENIRRTMTLLSGSTPQKRNKVRVLIYGQSLSKQSWSRRVRDELSKRFPYADLEFYNRSIGGFISSMLVRTIAHDVIPLYPDLVIFHDYGNEDAYEEIIRQIRTNTTAELMVQTDPVTPGQKLSWHDSHAKWMRGLAERWRLELVDIRQVWTSYMDQQKISVEKLLLEDKGHLNDWGNFVWAEATLQRFVPASGSEEPSELSGANSSIKDVLVGTNVKWTDNILRVPFMGNRVDLISPPNAKGAVAQVLIDGKAPSQFPQLYAFTRPNADANRDWPWATGAVIRVDAKAPLVLEDWTLTFNSVDLTGKVFGFELRGSVTGFDGSGDTASPFLSNSGRVALNPSDWFLDRVHGRNANRIGIGYNVTFSVVPQFKDTFIESGCVDADRQCAITIAQGLPMGPHTLELIHMTASKPGLSAVRVYKPMEELR